MSTKNTIFYHKKKQVSIDFSAQEISSDGGFSLLYKLARKSKIIKSFCELIPDRRDPLRIVHDLDELVLQRVLLLACGYEDGNDLHYLKKDPILNALLEEGLCSQPTMSRLENSLNMGDVYRLAEWWIDHYVESLPSNKKHVIIDVDCTDDPTHGNQQGSLFHGYYWQWMLNELFYHPNRLARASPRGALGFVRASLGDPASARRPCRSRSATCCATPRSGRRGRRGHRSSAETDHPR